MNSIQFKKILACPLCKNRLSLPHKKGCKNRYRKFIRRRGIWDFVYTDDDVYLAAYEKLHTRHFGKIDDGSYEIFAAIAKGSTTIDIACGDGYIESLVPEVVGVEFSYNALLKAKKNGGKYLVRADAHSLPFADNSFDIAICSGSLEHFENPLKALKEMARVSKIQVLTIHRKLPIPFANFVRSLVLKIKSIPDQPIDKPLGLGEIEKLFKSSKLHIVFKGYWTYPFNFELLKLIIPEYLKIPSCYFIISIKK